MTVTEKVAYLKGLMEGLELDKTTKEGKILAVMADVLEDMALSIADLEDENADIADYVDELDYDLGDLEEYVYGEDDDDEEYDFDDDEFDDDDFDEFDELDDDDDEEEAVFFEVECPSCNDKIYLDDSIDPSDVICPNCHEHFDIEFEGCCDCENCDGCDECEECEE